MKDEEEVNADGCGLTEQAAGEGIIASSPPFGYDIKYVVYIVRNVCLSQKAYP